MAFLGTQFPNPKTHKIICCHHHLHPVKPLKQLQLSQFPTTQLSHQFRFSSLRCLSQKQRQSTQKPLKQVEKEEEEEQEGKEVQKYEFEKLFSNLNQATLKHEPGSLSSSIFLVAGTTVGAGILAIPAVTQESGFLASAVACIGCWAFMVVTGLLIAEININTMCVYGKKNHRLSRGPSCLVRYFMLDYDYAHKQLPLVKFKWVYCMSISFTKIVFLRSTKKQLQDFISLS